MSSMAAAEPSGDQHHRKTGKFIFFLFVSGATMLCVGVLLSIFGFRACQHETLMSCSTVLKIAGPSCAVVGLGAIILARSQAYFQLLEERQRGSLADPDQDFLCGESRQFVQCVVFGFLFLISGLLISILGLWLPGCGSNWTQELPNESDAADTDPQLCGFLTLQIMGPLIMLLGLCFFVVAHVKKRSSLHLRQDATESEERPTQSTEPIPVTVGDAVIIFPPPPPPYFPEASASVGTRSQSHGANGVLPSENPPPYYSIFNYGTPAPEGQGSTSRRGSDSIFTISGTNSASEIPLAPHLPSELPPLYEDKEPGAVITSRPPPSEPSPP